mgnify:CR=1 FL=1
MNEIQKKLYQIINKFDARCKKYDITYYLGGGSALGALRHKGFLPWDDDIDLYITRENYKKLLSVQKDFFDDTFVHTFFFGAVECTHQKINRLCKHNGDYNSNKDKNNRTINTKFHFFLPPNTRFYILILPFLSKTVNLF